MSSASGNSPSSKILLEGCVAMAVLSIPPVPDGAQSRGSGYRRTLRLALQYRPSLAIYRHGLAPGREVPWASSAGSSSGSSCWPACGSSWPTTGSSSLRQRCRQAFSDIDVQLKQRHDLVPNLVETVKGYAAHEKGTLEAVIKARNAAVTAQGPAAQAAAEGSCRVRCARSSRWPRPIPTSRPTRTSSSCRPSCPTSRTRSPPRAGSSTTRQPSTTPRARASRPCCSPQSMGFSAQEFFNLDEAERKAVQTAPQVKF